MNPPAIHIILTTLGHTGRLRRTLASVHAQTLTDWECRIVLDQPAAAAPVRALVDSLRDPRLHLIVHARRQGAGAARNSGARATAAPLLAFLDDDDLWLPEKLQQHLDAHRTHPSAPLVFSDVITWWEEGVLPPCREHLAPPPSRLTFDALLLGSLALWTPSSVTVTRDAFTAVGGFTEDLSHAEDFDLYLRLARAGPFHHLPLPLTFYTHSTAGSMSTNFNCYSESIQIIIQRQHLLRRCHRRLLHMSAQMLVKSLIVALHQHPRPAAVRPVLFQFLRTYRLAYPVLLAKLIFISLLPFSCYRLWYSRRCRPQDDRIVRTLLDSLAPTP